MSRAVSQIMSAKWSAIQSEVNQKRRMQPNETLERAQFKAILDELGISGKEWSAISTWAKRNSPNMWELMVKHAQLPVKAKSEPEPEPEAEEPAAPCVAAAFTNVVAWLEPLEEADRSRVITGVRAFYGVA